MRCLKKSVSFLLFLMLISLCAQGLCAGDYPIKVRLSQLPEVRFSSANWETADLYFGGLETLPLDDSARYTHSATVDTVPGLLIEANSVSDINKATSWLIEREVSASLRFEEGAAKEDINLALDIYLLNPFRAMGKAEPLNMIISVDKKTYTIPSSQWSYVSGLIIIDFSEDVELFQKIANSKSTVFSMTYSDISAEIFTLQKGQPFHDTVKSTWDVFKAAKLDKVF